MRASNCINHGIFLGGGVSNVTIQNSEVFNNGSATVNATGTAGIDIGPRSGGGISKVRIGPNNLIHGNNGGISITNAPSSANAITDVSVFENDISGNVNDAVLVSAVNPSGGKILNFSAKGNRLSCNGWPANGTGFPTACTAENFQAGSISSGNGVGVDLIQNGDQLLVQPVVANNSIHDNVFEGVATASQIFATVNTSNGASGGCASNCVTWTAGTSTFNTNWKSGQVVTVNTIPFKISSVVDTTHLSLTTAPGTQTGVGLAGPSYMWASITGNQFTTNGNSLQSVGPGAFCFMADGNTYGQNAYRTNNLEGNELDFCSFATVSGDHAYSNNTSNTVGRNNGFAAFGSLGSSFLGVAADDPVASPKQTVGLLIDSQSTNTTVSTQALFGTVAALTNNGNGTIISGSTAQDCGTTTTCSATNISATVKIVKGSVALSTGTATITGISPAFTSSSSFVCTGTDGTSAAAVKIVNASSSSITITGTGTDTVNYICSGT
jgi:hypothetical protein